MTIITYHSGTVSSTSYYRMAFFAKRIETFSLQSKMSSEVTEDHETKRKQLAQNYSREFRNNSRYLESITFSDENCDGKHIQKMLRYFLFPRLRDYPKSMIFQQDGDVHTTGTK